MPLRQAENVLSKFDVESTKTVGLVEAIIAERERPRCDLFWNNEILNTVRLEKLGLLGHAIHPRAKITRQSFAILVEPGTALPARARI